MKSLLRFLLLTAFALAFAVCLDAQTTPTTSAVDNLAPLAAPFIVTLAQAHPWVLTLLTIMASLRVVCKPLVTLAEAWVKSTPSTEDDELLAKVEHSAGWKIFYWLLDLFASIKAGSQFTARPEVSAPSTPVNGESL